MNVLFFLALFMAFEAEARRRGSGRFSRTKPIQTSEKVEDQAEEETVSQREGKSRLILIVKMKKKLLIFIFLAVFTLFSVVSFPNLDCDSESTISGY